MTEFASNCWTSALQTYTGCGKKHFSLQSVFNTFYHYRYPIAEISKMSAVTKNNVTWSYNKYLISSKLSIIWERGARTADIGTIWPQRSEWAWLSSVFTRSIESSMISLDLVLNRYWKSSLLHCCYKENNVMKVNLVGSVLL